ncbi:transcription factor SPT20 homolog isoform X2 [Sabethes cyaneus]|uniref:transcription factor SPT20 homolog isoform X2 n=1 Tax=Sabethes cyaneus TaxID=53552 RepID=UPI00237E692A|nr:transcription factor SPT20 homolog isoform X2 [Sabethes cyaneus]
MSKFAWVTLATNDSYSLGALVVAHSLKRVHTAHQLAVLITPGVSEAMKNKLRAVFDVVEEVNLLDSKDAANLALLKRPELGITFTKLHCWRLVQYEKCVFLDADTLVLRNCDELFEREELSAAPDVGWPDCFNSGVYVYRPSLDTFSSLLQFAVTNGSFDGGDQGLLNSYFSDWASKDISKHLPFVYNTSSVASYSYLPAFKQFGQNTKILHFIGTAKPWLQNFNSETRKVYVPGGYQHLANFLQYWWDIFCEDVHSRLSSEMQKVFSRWIEPNKVSSGTNRSSGTGSFYTEGIPNIGGGGFDDYNGNDYRQHWQELTVNYDTPVEYVDPWEEYLRRQEVEREQRAREQQRIEEERLYFQYLDNQRLQEQQQRQQHEQQQAQQHHAYHQQDHTHHHHHQDHRHHDHYQDANVFQSTEQWVEQIHRHDQGGHWEPAPPPVDMQSNQVEVGGSDRGGGGGNSNWHSIDTHQAQQPPPPDQFHASGDQQIVTTDHRGGSGGGGADDDREQHQQLSTQQDQPQQDQANHGDGAGLAAALSQLHLGEPKSVEQEAYEEHMRRQCWEQGNIDYMGRDSFDNIWRRIQETLKGAPQEEPAAEPVPDPAPAPVPVRVSPPRRRSSKSRSRSTTPKRDPRDRSPTPQPEDNVLLEKKEGYQQVITTKTPEGKTRTETKTVYDPSVDDDNPAVDVVDAPMTVTLTSLVESRIEPVKPLEPPIVPINVSIQPIKPVEQKVEAIPASKREATPPPPRTERKPSPPRVSPRPQMQQQVAQESMAAKFFRALCTIL